MRADREKRTAAGRLWAVAGMCVLLLLAMGWIFFCHLFGEKDGGAERIVLTLPALEGTGLDEATRALPDDRYHVTVLYLHDAEQPAGTVLRQTPSAGSRRKLALGREKMEIKLVVSLGPRYEAVPSLVGTDGRQAKIELENKGLFVKVIRRTVQGRSVVADRVIRQEPEGGSRLTAGSTVTLYVAYPEESASVRCPELVGLDRMSAMATLRSAGLTVGSITVKSQPLEPFSEPNSECEPNNEQPPISAFWATDTVVSQSRPAGCLLPKGAAVDLVLQQNSFFHHIQFPQSQEKGIERLWKTAPNRPNFTEGS